jgi:hypothetical protein
VESYDWQSGDWENMCIGIREMRCNGTEVMWHRKMTWRQRGGYSGRRSGDKNNTGGGDIGDRSREARGGGERDM